LDAYTEVEITVPLSGEMYVYSNPEEPAIRYIETYGGSYTYKYKNEEMTPCESELYASGKCYYRGCI
jgi:hypothetical protein